MQIKRSLVIFLSFVILTACGGGSEDVNGSNESSSVVDKSELRVNGVKVYTRYFPTRTSFYGFDGELRSTFQSAINVEEGTVSTTSARPTSTDEPLPVASEVDTYNELGQHVQSIFHRFIENSTETGLELSDSFTRFELVYEGESLVTRSIFNNSSLDERTQLELDANNRMVSGSNFRESESEPNRVWTRVYNDSGWQQTEMVFDSQFSALFDDDRSSTTDVTVNAEGLIEKIVTKDGLITPVLRSTEVFTYDDQERLTQSEVFSGDGTLVERGEFSDYQDIGVYWHKRVTNSLVFGTGGN